MEVPLRAVIMIILTAPILEHNYTVINLSRRYLLLISTILINEKELNSVDLPNKGHVGNTNSAINPL